MEGFIKLNRKLLDWEWYDDINTKTLFLHCLLKANWKQKRWHGIVIEPGQFVTSLPKLSEETHLSIHQVRTALEHLKATGDVADKGKNKYRIITVNNWDRYQQDGRQVADKWQTSGRQVATTEERKKRKKERNNTVSKFGDYQQRKYNYKNLEEDIK